MKSCYNHPEKKADNVCHECGNSFCSECLSEGVEYYYCNNPACQAKMAQEILKEEIVCPNCSHKLHLSYEERVEQKVHCPNCEALIDFKNIENQILEPDEFVEAISTLNQGDVAIIKSILDDAQISYYTTGENFLSVDPLIQPAKLYVKKEQFPDAVELLKNVEIHIWGASSKNEEAAQE